MGMIMSFLDKLKDLKNDAEAGAKDILRKKSQADAEPEDEEEEKPFGTYVGGETRVFEPAGEIPSPEDEFEDAGLPAEKSFREDSGAEAAGWGDEETPAASGGGFAGKFRQIAGDFRTMPTGKLILRLGIVAAAVVLLLVLLIASCSSGGRTPEESESSGGVIVEENSSGAGEEEPKPVEVVSRLEQIAAAFNINDDVVGWLCVPGLSDVNSVVCQDVNSYSYNYRDASGKYVYSTYWIDGAYYASKYNTFEGGAAGLSKNTIIFGHSDLGSTNLDYKADDASPALLSAFLFHEGRFREEDAVYLLLDRRRGYGLGGLRGLLQR
jgi:hypothetical protein